MFSVEHASSTGPAMMEGGGGEEEEQQASCLVAKHASCGISTGTG